MNIAAFDLSLTATGWARCDDAGVSSGVLVPPKGCNRGYQRLRWIRNAMCLKARGAELVVLEGYAFAAANRAHQMGELGGVVRLTLLEGGWPFVDVPPSSLKLFATGKGNAPKDEVLARAIRHCKYAGSDHNEADALWLLSMATLRYSDFPVVVPQFQLRALQKIQWPKLPEATDAVLAGMTMGAP